MNFWELFENSINSKEFSSRLIDPSIPGVQAKISAQMISFPLGVVKRNKRYLLKIENKNFEDIIENELFFMNLASYCGLETAPVSIIKDKENNSGLLVQRFDRYYDREKKLIKKVHQEDACQFLEKYPHDKYRLSLREIAEGITKYSSAPIIEINKLLKLKIYSYLVCNGDLHAKNISLYQNPITHRIELTPAYDLLSTLPYGDENMALHLEGKKNNLRKKDFISFGKRFGLRSVVVEKSISSIASKIEEKIDTLEQLEIKKSKISYLKKTIRKRLNDFI